MYLIRTYKILFKFGGMCGLIWVVEKGLVNILLSMWQSSLPDPSFNLFIVLTNIINACTVDSSCNRTIICCRCTLEVSNSAGLDS